MLRISRLFRFCANTAGIDTKIQPLRELAEEKIIEGLPRRMRLSKPVRKRIKRNVIKRMYVDIFSLVLCVLTCTKMPSYGSSYDHNMDDYR